MRQSALQPSPSARLPSSQPSASSSTPSPHGRHAGARKQSASAQSTSPSPSLSLSSSHWSPLSGGGHAVTSPAAAQRTNARVKRIPRLYPARAASATREGSPLAG